MDFGINPSAWLEAAQTLPLGDLETWGTVLVIAPHQDDESLGCGGTIALLKQAGVSVKVVFTTDGSLSHPNSKQYPKPKLVQLREQEALTALQLLGVDATDVTFMRLPDGSLPLTNQPGFNEAAVLLKQLISDIGPDTILLPWHLDPHPDHRATWQIVDRAISEEGLKIRQLQYLVWLWERAAESDLPKSEEVNVTKISIETVIGQKKEAIAAHLSQTTHLINDDPDGFILSAQMLAHFDHHFEYFIEFI